MENGRALNDVWSDIQFLRGNDPRKTGYPTEKPQPLLERLILATTPDEGLVFDFFMGSGTTQAAAMQTGRRFIGADINLGAVETTITKLRAVTASIKSEHGDLLDAKAGTKRFLDDTASTIGAQDGSSFNVIISNTQKIILKRRSAAPTATEKLFSEKTGTLSEVYGELYEMLGEAAPETDADLAVNARFQRIDLPPSEWPNFYFRIRA